MTRPTSYSAVVFQGDWASEIPQLLSDCGYRVLDQASDEGSLVGLNEAMGLAHSDDVPLVLKAYWSSPTLTVLIDPEMIVSAASDETLIDFCVSNKTSAIAFVWERLSQTVSLTEIGQSGLLGRTFYVAGQPVEEQLNPRPEIVGNPSDEGLRAAIEAAGLPVATVFGSSAVAVLVLIGDA